MSTRGLVDPPLLFPQVWGNHLELSLELESNKVNEG